MSIKSLVKDALFSKYSTHKFVTTDVSGDPKYFTAIQKAKLNPQIGFEPSIARRLEQGRLAHAQLIPHSFQRIESFDSEYINNSVNESIKDYRSNSGPPKDINISVLAAATKIVIKQLKLKELKLEPLSNSESALTLKRDKSSCFPYFMKKGAILDKIIRVADFAVENRNFKIFSQPCVCFHRVQFRKSEPKLRQIWGYPADITLLENKFAAPFVDAIKDSNTPYVVGLKNLQIGCRVHYIQASHKYQYSLDWSKFDRTVPYWAIKICFDILKPCFLFNSDSPEWLWRKLVKYFINTPMLTRDGMVTIKSKGVPSGSGFTNIIDSMVNLLLINYSLLLHNMYLKPNSISVMGDDVIFGSDKRIDLSYFTGIANNFGMVINLEKSFIHKRGDKVYFLGYEWEHCVPKADMTTMAHQMIYPEGFIPRSTMDDRTRILSRSLSICLNAVGGQNLIEDLFKFGPGTAISCQLGTDNFYDLAWDSSGLKGGPLPIRSIAKHWQFGPLIR